VIFRNFKIRKIRTLDLWYSDDCGYVKTGWFINAV